MNAFTVYNKISAAILQHFIKSYNPRWLQQHVSWRGMQTLHNKYVYLIVRKGFKPYGMFAGADKYDPWNARLDSNGYRMLRALRDMETGIDEMFVRAFLFMLYHLARSGQIPESYLRPLQVQKETKIKKKVIADQTVLDALNKSVKEVTGIPLPLILLGVAGVYYIYKRGF